MMERVEWIQRLKGSNCNQNDKSWDYTQAVIYRDKCLKEFGFDPLYGEGSTFPKPLCNQNPKVKMNAHWVSKFEYHVRTNTKRIHKEIVRKKLKVVRK